jgi:hypothetical protein
MKSVVRRYPLGLIAKNDSIGSAGNLIFSYKQLKYGGGPIPVRPGLIKLDRISREMQGLSLAGWVSTVHVVVNMGG